MSQLLVILPVGTGAGRAKAPVPAGPARTDAAPSAREVYRR